MTRAQELAVQAGASANDSAAAAVLLGEVLWDMEAPRDALAAFRTAQMILTQSGLRTRQAARVLYWMARCATKLARLEAAKRDLRQAAAILTAIYPSGHADLDDVHEAQAQLFLDLKQYKRSARILTPLAAAPRRAAVSARALRLLTMRFVANASLESWGDAAVDLGRAAAEAEHLWTRLQNAGAPLCAPRLTFRPRNAEQHEGGPRVRAAALPRSERVTALQRRAMVAEVQLHLSTLVSLGCFCMHVGGRAAAGTWAPLVARAAGEALLWHDYRDAGIASALLMVADSLRGAGTTDQALHVYFCTYDYWATWADLESVRCSAVLSEITRSKPLWWAAGFLVSGRVCGEPTASKLVDARCCTAAHHHQQRTTRARAVQEPQRQVRGAVASLLEDETDEARPHTGRSHRSSAGHHPLATPRTSGAGAASRDVSLAASDGDDSAASSARVLSPPPPLPRATRVMCLQGLATCLYAQRQLVAEVRATGFLYVGKLTDAHSEEPTLLQPPVCLHETWLRPEHTSFPWYPSFWNAQVNVLRDLARALDEDGVATGTPAARKKVMVMRRIGSSLVSQNAVAAAVEAFRACVAEAQRLLPEVWWFSFSSCSCFLLGFCRPGTRAQARRPSCTPPRVRCV